MADAAIQDVHMKAGLEFGAVVSLDKVDLEGQLLEDVVEKPDCGLLVQAIEDLENAEPGAVIDGGTGSASCARP